MRSSVPAVSAAQFSTALALRPNLVAWFLGAGASAASGIPTWLRHVPGLQCATFRRENNLFERKIDTGDQDCSAYDQSLFGTQSTLRPHDCLKSISALAMTCAQNLAVAAQSVFRAVYGLLHGPRPAGNASTQIQNSVP